MVTAIDQGGYFMGKLKTPKTPVLYCALENTHKRLQKRMKKQGLVRYNGSRVKTKPPGLSSLTAYLTTNPQFRVVIIDTLQKMAGIGDLNDYSETVKELGGFKSLAGSLNIAILLIHHNRKGSSNDTDHMGSAGINAAADCTITVRRPKRGDVEATLS
jgi:RecA-family ATPase